MERNSRKINIIGIIMLALCIQSIYAEPEADGIATYKNNRYYTTENGDFPISIEPGNQHYPAIAWDGSNFLVVWGDWRNNSDYDIYGQRVDSLGDTLGQFTISTVADNQENPAVAWDGTNHHVVWQDYRNGSDWNIYGQRVNPSGGLEDTNFVISIASGNQSLPAIAWDGINYLVAWRDSRNGSFDIYGQRVNPSGGLQGNNFAISTATDVQCWPAIASDSINYFVVWQDCRSGGYENADIYGQMINHSGDTLGQFAISTATDGQQIPAIAWDGINYLVVWHDTRNGYPDIYGQMVNPSGGLVDPDFPISIAANHQCYSAIAWNDTRYLIAWDDCRTSLTDWDIYGNIDVGQTGIKEVETENLHKLVEINLYPNPFREKVEIKFRMTENRGQNPENRNNESDISIRIFDVTGRKVREFILYPSSFILPAKLEWDGKDFRNQGCPIGFYFCRFEVENIVEIKKLLLLR
ncbi:hypothetical protein KAX75_04360 [candidate division WOR-3 bacterium]|nr:hypothetical protein [candidate division WOR-3 bacterium]